MISTESSPKAILFLHCSVHKPSKFTDDTTRIKVTSGEAEGICMKDNEPTRTTWSYVLYREWSGFIMLCCCCHCHPPCSFCISHQRKTFYCHYLTINVILSVCEFWLNTWVKRQRMTRLLQKNIVTLKISNLKSHVTAPKFYAPIQIVLVHMQAVVTSHFLWNSKGLRPSQW